MSSINPQQAPLGPSSTSKPPSPHSAQHPPTAERLNTLLKAGPNWSAPPKAPDRPRAPLDTPVSTSNTSPSAQDAQLTKKLGELDAALTPETIQQIQRDPSSSKSRVILDELKTVLSQKNIRSMSRGPNAKKNRSMLGEIRNKLDKKTLDSNLNATRTQMTNETRERITLKMLEASINSIDGDLWGSIEPYRSSLEQLNNVRKKFSEMEPACTLLINTGDSLSNEKLDKAASETDTNTAAGTPTTYSFNSVSESTLGAPREIRDFKPGDKLNLAGIQRQLNTPLRKTDRTPEASGEMQILHSPATNTSVVVIADAPGKPPFVLKVFGEVRQSNIVT